MLSVTNKPSMLGAVTLNVVMLNVVMLKFVAPKVDITVCNLTAV
jgi:hypothetical protein